MEKYKLSTLVIVFSLLTGISYLTGNDGLAPLFSIATGFLFVGWLVERANKLDDK